MKDKEKTKEQLLDELIRMRSRIAELEGIEDERKRMDVALRERGTSPTVNKRRKRLKSGSWRSLSHWTPSRILLSRTCSTCPTFSASRICSQESGV